VTGNVPGAVDVTFAKGVLDDVAELTKSVAEGNRGGKD
jgi:hypothetical protein